MSKTRGWWKLTDNIEVYWEESPSKENGNGKIGMTLYVAKENPDITEKDLLDISEKALELHSMLNDYFL